MRTLVTSDWVAIVPTTGVAIPHLQLHGALYQGDPRARREVLLEPGEDPIPLHSVAIPDSVESVSVDVPSFGSDS